MRFFQRAVLHLAVGMAIAAAPWKAASETPSAQPSRSGVVFKQTEIVGQVFVASERPGRRDEPAENVVIQVRVPENNDVVHQTQTNRDGGYTIPTLRIGAYHLYVGGLRLNLIVEEGFPREGEQPKVIITILPREMLRRTR